MSTAFVLIKCKDDAEGSIGNLDETEVKGEIEPTVGHYDFVAKITSPDMKHLDKAIGEIHRDDKVRSTHVLRLNEPVEAA